MLKNRFLIVLLFLSGFRAVAQISSTDPEFEAKPVGGSEQIGQVLETQFTLPKIVLASNFETELTLYFNIDSTGNAVDFKAESHQYKSVITEAERMFRFLKFRRTLNLPDERPYFLTFHLSRDKYNKYYKQKSKLTLKKTVPADSSYTVYSRADRSPDYYKNGEDGLKEFILSELEYPRVAVEKSVEGTVIIEFVVETNGYITNIVTKQGVNAGCTEEAIRILKQTKWQPAMLHNKLVRYRMSYPITFGLRNIFKNYGNSTGSTIGQ